MIIKMLLGLTALISVTSSMYGETGRFSDTLSYDGLIAVEMSNKMLNNHGKAVDAIDTYNETNCRGFVLFKKNISEINFEEFFFPLGLCDAKTSIGNICENNNRFYDTIFNNVKRIGKSYNKTINIKRQGSLRLNYKILKVHLKYVVAGKGTLFKYVRKKINSDRDVRIESNICKIIFLQIQSPNDEGIKKYKY